MSTSRRLHRTVQGLAIAAAAALVLPVTVSAAPAAVPATPLARAIETLRANGSPNQVALAAAKSIARATPSASDVAEPSDLLGAYQSSVDLLRGLGIEPFLYPTGAAYCTDTGEVPLGITPAVAGAVPGSWPNRTFLGYPINIVNPGETLFAFVPFGVDGDGENTTGMQVAWFNASTFQGGFVPMGTLGETAKAAIPQGLPDFLRPGAEQLIEASFANAIRVGGVRAAPVETGSGTVLAAVFGSVQNGEKSCFFFPTVGITEVR